MAKQAAYTGNCALLGYYAEISLSVLNRGKEGKEEKCLSNAGRRRYGRGGRRKEPPFPCEERRWR